MWNALRSYEVDEEGRTNWNKIVMEHLGNINPWFKKVWDETERTLFSNRKWEIVNPSIAEKNTIDWFSNLPQSYPDDIAQKYSKFKILPEQRKIINSFSEKESYYFRVISEVMMKDIIQAYLQTLDPNTRVFNTTPYDDTYHGIDVIVETTDASWTHYSWIDVCISDKSWLAAKKLWVKNEDFWYSDNYIEWDTPAKNYESNSVVVKPWSEFEVRTGYSEVIPRSVKDFNPEIMAFVFEKYLSDIQQGIDPSINVFKNYLESKSDVANEKWHSSTVTEVPLAEVASQVLWVIEPNKERDKKTPTLSAETKEIRKTPKERTRKILTLKTKNGQK